MVWKMKRGSRTNKRPRLWPNVPHPSHQYLTSWSNADFDCLGDSCQTRVQFLRGRLNGRVLAVW